MKVKRKQKTQILLQCKECKKIHKLTNLDENLICKCGNQIVTRTTNELNIQHCFISAKDILIKA